jgi:glycosyltransferase involved in cell wall biosynthesis
MHQEEDLRFLRLAKRLGIATVYTAHNLLPHDAPKPEERQAFAALYRSVDQIVVFAQSIRDQVIDSFSISPDRVSVVPQGSASLLLQKFSQAFARHELGIPAASRVVLFFGHIKRYKGLEYLVEAFDRLHGLVEDVLLLVAGEISASDPGDHREYSDLIERLRIRKDVVCHAEYIPTSHVGLFFAAADVVALPYSHTYHSAILMTAYAAGKPVVVTDTGMLADDVQEGLTGFIVPPKDVSSLADRLAEILVRPDMRRRMGEAAQHLAETRYSWPSVAEKTISLYRQLLGAAGPPPRGNARAATPHAGRRAGRRGPRSLTPPGL